MRRRGSSVTLRSGRVAKVTEKHDEYLKKRVWYDIITTTLDENWVADGNDEFDSESGDDAT